MTDLVMTALKHAISIEARENYNPADTVILLRELATEVEVLRFRLDQALDGFDEALHDAQHSFRIITGHSSPQLAELQKLRDLLKKPFRHFPPLRSKKCDSFALEAAAIIAPSIYNALLGLFKAVKPSLNDWPPTSLTQDEIETLRGAVAQAKKILLFVAHFRTPKSKLD